MLFQSSKKKDSPSPEQPISELGKSEWCQSTFLAKRDSFRKKREGQSVFLLLGMAIALFVKHKKAQSKKYGQTQNIAK
jgi:hypothetical protein